MIWTSQCRSSLLENQLPSPFLKVLTNITTHRNLRSCHSEKERATTSMFAKAPPCRFCTRTKLWREASSHITFIACGPCLLSVISPRPVLLLWERWQWSLRI